MKRFALIVMLVIISLVSCTNAGHEESVRTKPPITSLPAVTEKANESSQTVIAIDISPMVYSRASLDVEYSTTWNAFIIERFGIEINLTDIQKSSDYDASRGIRDKIQSGQLTGLVYVTSKGYNVIYDLIKSESIMPLDDLISENTSWSQLPENMKSISEINGAVWGIPDQLNPYYYIRKYKKDWLTENNLDIPYNADSFYNTLRVFTDNDPDNDGINNTKGTYLAVHNTIDVFCEFEFFVQPNNGYYGFSSIAYNPKKDTFEDSMFSDNAVEVFNYLRTIISNGYADVQFEKDTTYGTYASYYRNDTGTYDGPMDSYFAFKYDDSFEYSMGFSKSTSCHRFFNMEGGLYVLCNNSGAAEATINSFLDTFYGDKAGYYAAKLGIEQESFTIKNNIVNIESIDISNRGMPLLVGNIEGLYQEDNLIYGNNETKHNEILSSKEFCESLYSSNSHKIYDLYPKTGYLVYEKDASYTVKGNSMTMSGLSNSEELLRLFNTMYDNLLNNDIDLNDAINEYMSEANKLELQKYLDEINGKLDQ